MPNLSPHHRINQVPLPDVQHRVIQVLRRFGLPKAMRFDNGAPFADTRRQFTPRLALWLMGLGIQPLYNDAYKPQQNAKVERHQGTLGNWVDVGTCSHYAQFTERLRAAHGLQWQRYPTRIAQFQSRLAAYPDLIHSGRPYQLAAFDFSRVQQHLQHFTWVRRISAKGAVSIYNVYYQVGYRYRERDTLVTYEPTSHQWQFWDTDQNVLFGQLSVKNISPQQLTKLT